MGTFEPLQLADVPRFENVAALLSPHCGEVFAATYKDLLSRPDCALFFYEEEACEATLGFLFVPAVNRYKLIYSYSNQPENAGAASATATAICDFLLAKGKGLYTALTLAAYPAGVTIWLEACAVALQALGAEVVVTGSYIEVNLCPPQS